ncbi:MAG: hypothetical protein K1X64_07985 [Myxococcaceae bacterium]|nr:hypothetical protein [Myxococcaceae bacterium]
MLTRLAHSSTQDRWLSASAFAAGALVLGYGLQVSNGTQHPAALNALSITILLTVLGLSAVALRSVERWQKIPLLVIAMVGFGYQMAVAVTAPPGIYLQGTQADFVLHHQWIAAVAVLSGAAVCVPDKWLKWAVMPAVLVAHFALGLWLLRVSPNPRIDVFVWHREAFEAFFRGENPWAMTLPNIYGTTQWYAPGLADTQHVFTGFPYPPLSFLLALPGHLIAHDYRYANLAALTAAGALMTYARPGRLGGLAAIIFLFSPRHLFVLEQGWTEANVIFMVAAVVFTACRFPRALPWVLGLTLAIKQYMVFILPVSFFLLPVEKGKPFDLKAFAIFCAKAVGLAAVVTGWGLVWNPTAFFNSVVAFQAKQPFRPDALSYISATADNGVPTLPLSLHFVGVLLALGFALWRAPRTPAGFAATTSLVVLLFFAFAKQAFCNYYFVAVGTLCIALAVLEPAEDEALTRARADGLGATVGSAPQPT